MIIIIKYFFSCHCIFFLNFCRVTCSCSCRVRHPCPYFIILHGQEYGVFSDWTPCKSSVNCFPNYWLLYSENKPIQFRPTTTKIEKPESLRCIKEITSTVSLDVAKNTIIESDEVAKEHY